MKKLGECIFSHDNDFRFDVRKILNKDLNAIAQTLSLSIVIPYFESAESINLLLRHLLNAIRFVKNKFNKEWQSEILIIDDGSLKYPASRSINPAYQDYMRITRNKRNKGRSHCRNIGLCKSRFNLVMFLDSDILIDQEQILNHLKIQAQFSDSRRKCISFSLFQFAKISRSVAKKTVLYPRDIKINDFRKYCVYPASWYGRKEDRRFAGRKFEIIKNTNQLKAWPNGFYGPWILPNMVLGGLFVIDRNHGLRVGGFSESFRKHGFTETTLIVKLVGKYHDFVVPQVRGGGIHLGGKNVDISEPARKELFRKAYKKFHSEYLQNDTNRLIIQEKRSFCK